MKEKNMKERRKEKKKNLSLTLSKAGHQSSAEPPAASPCTKVPTTTPPGGTELPHPDHLPENPLCFLCLDLSIASQPITAKKPHCSVRCQKAKSQVQNPVIPSTGTSEFSLSGKLLISKTLSVLENLSLFHWAWFYVTSANYRSQYKH